MQKLVSMDDDARRQEGVDRRRTFVEEKQRREQERILEEAKSMALVTTEAAKKTAQETIEAARDEALQRIELVTDYDALADRQLVVEAVLENEAAKEDVFSILGRVVKDPAAILASNTSSIPIMITKRFSRIPSRQ